MERDMSFELPASAVTLFQAKLRAATHDGVPGRWQPRHEASWDDAWLNVSQCLGMAAARAHHERQYEVEDALIRFNSLLLRATAWRSELTAPDEIVCIRCGCPAWNRDSWFRFEKQVKGYHSIHFEAALQDCKHLAACLESEGQFGTEKHWLRMGMTQLELTEICMTHGESREDECWGDFCVDAATRDTWRQILVKQLGDDLEEKLEYVRMALWVTAARCSDQNSLVCLRLIRLIESCFIPPERMRFLPGNFLIVSVEVPEWCEEWSAAQMCPEPYRVKVLICESLLLQLLPDLKTIGRSREVIWTEQALCLLGGTLEILSLSQDAYRMHGHTNFSANLREYPRRRRRITSYPRI